MPSSCNYQYIAIWFTSHLIGIQLRGEAGKRQVDNARIGLQQNFGIGGAAVVTLYGKFDKNNVPQARL